MEKEVLNNPSKEELFVQIKHKCKSRAQVALYVGIMVLLLVLAALIYTGIWLYRGHETSDLIYFILFTLFGCAQVWSMLSNYRFLQQIEELDSPDKLLHCLEKKAMSDKIAVFVILFIAGFSSGLWYSKTQIWTIGIVLLAFVIYLFIKPKSSNRQDMKIIERLHELIEME